MEFSNKVLGKSIVAVIYRTFGSSFRALEYVNSIENFSRKDKLVNKYLGGFVMKMVGRSRAKLFEQPPRENLKTQLDTTVVDSREISLEEKTLMALILQIMVFFAQCKLGRLRYSRGSPRSLQLV